MRHGFIFIFYKSYVFQAIFLLIQDSPFIWEYSGKISLGWKYIFMTTVRLYACLTAMMHSLNNILNA